MSKLVWDATGEHLYETGVKQCALYVVNASGAYTGGVAWNGITSISESPTGADANALYADDQKYLNLIAAEEFEASVEAYTYPDEFGQCDGSVELTDGVTIGQQSRKTFGLCYRTVVGNDVSNDEYGYKLHLMYGAVAAPSEKAYETVNDSPEAITFSWELKTTPVNVTNNKPTALLTVDSTKATATNLKALEAVLYGAETFSDQKAYAAGDCVEYAASGSTAKLYQFNATHAVGNWTGDDADEVGTGTAGPRLPLPDEVKTIMTPAD